MVKLQMELVMVIVVVVFLFSVDSSDMVDDMDELKMENVMMISRVQWLGNRNYTNQALMYATTMQTIVSPSSTTTNPADYPTESHSINLQLIEN